MEPLGWIPRYDSMTTLAEIDVRGRFLMMSADIEFTLLLIMTYLSPDPLNQARRFKGMMMHNKIESTISDIKKYKPDLYIEYEQHLIQLWEFKIIRNDMAHHRMHFENVDPPSYFEIYYVDEDQGIERLATKRYLIKDAVETIRNFRRLNMTLYSLFQTIQEEFIKDNPGISLLGK